MNPSDPKFQNYSNASRITQSKLSKEFRKTRSSNAAKTRWANTTPEQRRAYALKMVEAKQFGKLKNEKA